MGAASTKMVRSCSEKCPLYQETSSEVQQVEIRSSDYTGLIYLNINSFQMIFPTLICSDGTEKFSARESSYSTSHVFSHVRHWSRLPRWH